MYLRNFFFVLLACVGLFSVQSCGLFQESEDLTHGSSAPAFTLPDKDGNEVSLENFQGYIILLNFWASWCQPCRRKNPEYIELYSRYKESRFREAKGFKVVSISLDEQKNRWLGAIESQNLFWEDHLSDLLGNRSPVANAYQVRNIPQSFLIDHNGNLLGKNLSKTEISRQLEWRMAYN